MEKRYFQSHSDFLDKMTRASTGTQIREPEQDHVLGMNKKLSCKKPAYSELFPWKSR